MNKSDAYFRELDQKPIPKTVQMPTQPKESIAAGEDYYAWLNRMYGESEPPSDMQDHDNQRS